MSKDDEIVKHGAVTEYRPHKDDVSGGADKSVQTEALGAEGAANLSNSSASSGGAAGRVNTIDHNPTPKRDGGENDDNTSDLTR
ncbi:MAG TPA: hypothetical protein VGF69_07245 [Thermoanaerobaculia bacterium]|jgi:hypothetical protein